MSSNKREGGRGPAWIQGVVIGIALCGPFATIGWAQERPTDRLNDEIRRLEARQEEMRRQITELSAQLEEQQRRTEAPERTEEQLNALRLLHELDTRRVDHVLTGVDPEESGFLSAGLFGGKFRLDMSGYLKIDTNWANQQLQDGDLLFTARANQTPLDNHQFTISPRETRFSITVQGPPILGAQSGAKIEMDFFGDVGGLDAGANIAQPEPVLRAGFFNLLWSNEDRSRTTQILVGQDFVPFGNWFPHLTTFAKGIDVGTYFLLAPQIKAIQSWKFGSDKGQEFRVSGAVARSISGTFGLAGDLNTGNNFIGIGEQSGLPQFHLALLYSNDVMGRAPFWGVPTPLTLSVSGTYGQERLINFGGGINEEDFDKWGADLKFFVPVIGSSDGRPGGTLSLKGYAAVQENLNEGLGNGLTGIVVNRFVQGQPQDPEEDLESSFAVAGWTELTYYLTDTTYLHGMWGRLANDRFAGVVEGFAFPTLRGPSGVLDNQRFTVSLKQQFQNLLIGLDVSRVETDFMNGERGEVDNVLLGFYYFF